MRLKKLMSLVLACVLALSLVTVASAATEVLVYEDFSTYADGDAFVNKMTKTEGTTWSAELVKDPFVSGWHHTNGNAYLSGTIEKNTAGNTAFVTKTNSNTYNFWYLLPEDKAVNLAAPENANKTVVYSYEFEWPTNGWGNKNEDFNRLLWTDTSKANPVEMNLYRLGQPSGGIRGLGFYSVTAGTPSNWLTLNPNQTYKLTVGITPGTWKDGIHSTGADAYKNMFTKTFVVDGAQHIVGGQVETAFSAGQTVLRGFRFGEGRLDLHKYANIKMYLTDSTFAVTASKTTGLSANDSVTFNFTNPVTKEVFDANEAGITVKKDGNAFAGYSVGEFATTIANGEINSSVTIDFTGLEEGSTYTVEFPAAIKNELAQELGENNTVTLATKTPELKIGNFTIVSGWNTPGQTENSASDATFTVSDSLQGGKLEITNFTDEEKPVAVIYAVYSNNQLTDVVYVNDVLKATGTTEIQAGVKLSAAGKVKAFVWDTINALSPYFNATERDIVAAQ